MLNHGDRTTGRPLYYGSGGTSSSERGDALFDAINTTTSREKRVEVLDRLENSDQQTLRHLAMRLSPVLAEQRFDRKGITNKLRVSSPDYIDIIEKRKAEDSASIHRAFLPSHIFELLQLLNPESGRGGNKQICKSIHSFENDTFCAKSLLVSPIGSLADTHLTTHEGLARTLAAMLEKQGPSQESTTPRDFVKLLRTLIEPITLEPTLELQTIALAWCVRAALRASAVSKPTRSNFIEPNKLLRDFSAPRNPNAPAQSARVIQSEFGRAFPNDTAQEQFGRMVLQGAFRDSTQLIRNQCPLLIPSNGDGLILPLCWTERKLAEVSQQPYLSAQVAWIQQQPGGAYALFIARFHSLHRNDHELKCPTMRIMRIIPDLLSSNSLEPRQYLVDNNYPEFDLAIRRLGLEHNVVIDSDDNHWISFQHLEAALSRVQYSNRAFCPKSVMLAATHFPRFSKRMLEPLR